MWCGLNTLTFLEPYPTAEPRWWLSSCSLKWCSIWTNWRRCRTKKILLNFVAMKASRHTFAAITPTIIEASVTSVQSFPQWKYTNVLVHSNMHTLNHEIKHLGNLNFTCMCSPSDTQMSDSCDYANNFGQSICYVAAVNRQLQSLASELYSTTGIHMYLF